MLTEIRIESLGAISAAVGEFGRGLTVLTGETGTGKTMVVTGLHLLGGARADATRSGPEPTGPLSKVVSRQPMSMTSTAAQLDEILESRRGRSATKTAASSRCARSTVTDRRGAYLGGRSVPAKSLSGFTAAVLALHGQNDQLRLMPA